MSLRNGKLALLILAVTSAFCGSGKPDLCTGNLPQCKDNVAQYCVTIKDCDSCSYYASTLHDDCTAIGALYGVAESCVIGSGHLSGSALCVDASKTACTPGSAAVCDAQGHISDCLETVEGPLLRSCVTCRCVGQN